MPALASALARRARHSSVFPFVAWLGIVSVSFLIFSTRNNNSTSVRWNVLYTAPHAEFAPFQRVWNPDTNNDYSVQDFSSDEGDEDSGIVTDDVAGDDGKFKDVEVPAFNGEDYFDAKPIGCCHDVREQQIWSKWLSLKNRVAKMEGVVRTLEHKKSTVAISYKLDPKMRGKPGPPGPQGQQGPEGPQGARWIDCDIGLWNTRDGVCVACTNKPNDALYTSNANLFSPNTCAWECDSGFVRTGDTCAPCTTESCPAGQYRGACSKTSHGACQPCTNRPSFAVFAGSGSPFDSNTCPWKCAPTYFRREGSCAACSTSTCPLGQFRGPCGESDDGACTPCTTKPPNSDFSGGGIPFDKDQCPWVCVAGYFKKDGACAACSAAPCDAGMYRSPCSPSQDGVCTQCTNAPAFATYTGPGSPFDSNTCTWRCKKGFKVGPDGKTCQAIRFFDQCDPTVEGWDRNKFQLCLFGSSVNLHGMPKVGDADAAGSSLSFAGKGQMSTVSIRSVANFNKYLNKVPQANYAWAIYGMLSVEAGGTYLLCTTSSDGSKLYVDGATLAELVVNNEGMHGMLERCATKFLTSGSHLVYIEGWRGDGPGVGMIARYSGPDTNGQKILMRSGAPPLNNRFSSSCVPQLEGGVQPFSICVFRSEVPLRRIPLFGDADTGENRIYFVGKGKMPVVDMHRRLNFRQYVDDTPKANYAWVIFGELRLRRGGQYQICVSSDDGSRFYIGTNSTSLSLLVDDEGLHGMLEKCSSTQLAAGSYLVYIEGFQAGGGVGMEAWYSGPDTAGGKVLIRSGYAFGAATPASGSVQYFPECDPTVAPESTVWTVCTFRSEVSLSTIPEIKSAGTGRGRVYFVGKGSVPFVDFTDVEQFRDAVPFTPGVNFAWAIYGKLLVGIAGSYQLCISSDDGSKLYVDGDLMVDNEGLHGMQEKCSSKVLSAGPHVVYIEGFQAGGGVGMKAKYSGPDTDGSKILMMSGRVSSRYFPGCDPTKDATKESRFTVCIFKSKAKPPQLSKIPRIGDHVAVGTLQYLGKGFASAIDMHDPADFRAYAPETPEHFFTWAIYGSIQISLPGEYKLCIISDDGSNMFVEGALLVQNDGLHGMSEQCELKNFEPGLHPVYIEGFQNAGGVGMEIKYSGPDTGNRKIWLQSGVSGFLGRAKSLPSAQKPTQLKFSLPGGKPWKMAGNAIGLNSGTDMSLDLFADPSVWLSQFGWFGLLNGGNQNQAVRHSGYVMWTANFAANNWDFAWKLVADGAGYRIKSNFGVSDAHGGGWWVGYDKGSSRVLIVSATDERKVSWIIEPAPDPTFVTPQYYKDCDPSSSKPDAVEWSMCVFRSEVGLDQIPTFGEADTGLSRLYFVGKNSIPAIDLHDLKSFRQYVPSTPLSNYAWTMYGTLVIAAAGDYTLCISSDDGSRLSLDSEIAVLNEGFHGPQEKCATKTIAAGPHAINIDGWQGGGGVAMDATYSGPDTEGKKLYLRLGQAPNLKAAPRQFYPKCDPSAKGLDSSRWTICIFRSEVDLHTIPKMGDADVTTIPENRLYYVGQSRLPVINLKSVRAFGKLVKNIPQDNFAWSIFGTLEVGKPGMYTLCIGSDDGSKLYLDGDLIVDLDGHHPILEKCTKIDVASGSHIVYIEGFQGAGDAAMTAHYAGPDTNDEKIHIMSGRIPSRYFKDCDPATNTDSTPKFTICTFKKVTGTTRLSNTPRMGDAVSVGQLSFVGKGQAAIIDFHSSLSFRQYVSNTPDKEFGWAIFGNLLIEEPGKYTVCVESDDGSKLYIKGALLIENDGIHGMVEKCSDSQLEAGQHTVYVEGFQNRGGVGMEIKYMGPDTVVDGKAQKIFMRSGFLPVSMALSSKRNVGLSAARKKLQNMQLLEIDRRPAQQFSVLYQQPLPVRGPDFVGDDSNTLSTVGMNPNAVRAYFLHHHGRRSYIARETGRQRYSLHSLYVKAKARDLDASANFEPHLK